MVLVAAKAKAVAAKMPSMRKAPKTHAEEASYTVGSLAKLAGVTVRALHHYEDEGLLHPERTASGYRRYGAADVERLQQILLLRSCGLSLGDIRAALDNGDFDFHAVLIDHLATLRAQQKELETLVGTAEKNIASLEGRCTMTDEERFEGMKARAIAENEERYGAEVRQAYGDAAMDAANKRMTGMSQEEWSDAKALEAAILEQLTAAKATGNPTGEAARKLCAMHARWLQMHWGEGAYSPAAHAALAEGYVADPRFTAYYDEAAGEGATAFLRDALIAWCAEQ
mgnify:CR=1 FL=1